MLFLNSVHCLAKALWHDIKPFISYYTILFKHYDIIAIECCEWSTLIEMYLAISLNCINVFDMLVLWFHCINAKTNICLFRKYCIFSAISPLSWRFLQYFKCVHNCNNLRSTEMKELTKNIEESLLSQSLKHIRYVQKINILTVLLETLAVPKMYNFDTIILIKAITRHWLLLSL